MYSKYSRFSSSSSSSSSSTISNLRKINSINTLNAINNFNNSLANSYQMLYPSFPTETFQNNYNNNYPPHNPLRNSSFNLVANQIISPRNNINPYYQKRFTYDYNNNNYNNINNNFMKGSPVTINQDLKKTKCCAHNGCSAYISDVLYLLKELKGLGFEKKIKTEEELSEEIKEEIKGKQIKKKKRETKEEKKKKEKAIKWWKLAKNFVNVYYFFSVAKKYFLNYTPLRNTQIETRTHSFEEEVELLVDWILTIEDICFEEFENFIDENCAFEKGDSKNKIRRESLKIIGFLEKFIENIIAASSKLKNIPERIEQIIYDFIKNGAYFPKKYLNTFLITRLDFDYMGKTRNVTEEQSAMILAFLLLSVISSQEILCNIRERVKQFRNYANVLISAKYLAVILHVLVKNTFKNDIEPLDDIYALFNYYRNYNLENELIEKEKKKMIKANYDFEGLTDFNVDEYSKFFLNEDEIEVFFDSNEGFVETFKNNVFIWALKLSKLIKDKFARKDPYLLPKKQMDKPPDKIYQPPKENEEEDKEDKKEKREKKDKKDKKDKEEKKEEKDKKEKKEEKK